MGRGAEALNWDRAAAAPAVLVSNAVADVCCWNDADVRCQRKDGIFDDLVSDSLSET